MSQEVDTNPIVEDKDMGLTGDGILKNNGNQETGTGLINDNYPAKEHTRSKMALLFVIGFFAILFLCFAYSIKMNAPLSDLKDLLVAIIGALSGTLGFIVGYYYKSVQDK